MKQSISNKIFINFAVFIAAVICIFVAVVYWQLHKSTAEQADLLKNELASRTFSTVEGYHSITWSLLDTVREKVRKYGFFISHNSPIASTILRRQVESIAEFLQISATKEDIDFVLIFSDDGILLASSSGSKGYKHGDLHLPSRIELYNTIFRTKRVKDLLEKEISLQISPQESMVREKKISPVEFVRLDPDFLTMLGFDLKKINIKGTIAVVDTGIIRDEFSVPIGMFITGQLINNLNNLFQGLHNATGAATFLYLDRTPIVFTGVHDEELENYNRSPLSPISQSEAVKIHENNLPTHLVLSLPSERYLSSCTSINDPDNKMIGILCSGLPESQIKKIQTPLVSHGVETQKILQRWLIVIGVALVLISILLARIIALGITNPLERMVEFTEKLGAGDLSHRLKSTSTDEIGALSQSIDTMLDNLTLAQQEKEKLESELRQAHKMEAIGTLAGGIAHNFNNVLTAIMGYAELAKYTKGDGSPSMSYNEEILKAGHRAKELVQQILAFSRKSQETLQPLQPSFIINEALKLLHVSLPTTVEILEEIDPDCATIYGNPTNMHQVLMNLCTNAVHAMNDEKGTLIVTLNNVELTRENKVQSAAGVIEGSFVELMVSDTGHGMDKMTVERIFDPYFSTKEVGKGTGMGLSLIHGIVKECGGFIQVESELDKGTTFHIYFPAIEKKPAGVEKKQLQPLPLGGERILVVDDEEIIVDIYKASLEGLGYNVTAHCSSVEMLEVFQSSPDSFDLVITDQTMPLLSGEELAKQILHIRPNIPIILCTGYSSIISEEKAKEIGIERFMMKPVSIKDLAITVREVLDLRKS